MALNKLRKLAGFARSVDGCLKCVKNQRLNVRFVQTKAEVAVDNVLTSPHGEIAATDDTLLDHVFRDYAEFAHKPGVICGSSDRSYTFGMIRMMTGAFARALLAKLRLQPGDTIGLLLPNIPEFPIVIFGSMEAGVVVTFANPLYTEEEVYRQFSDCNVKAIVAFEMVMPIATAVGKRLDGYKGTIYVGGENDKAQGIHGLKSLLMSGYHADLPTVSADDVALIPYSSGTTGVPKGVVLTHRNLASNLRQTQTPALMKREGARGVEETVLTVPPFFHIYGFNGILTYNITMGFQVLTMPRFTPEDYLKCLSQYRPTSLMVVPSLLSFLSSHPAVTADHLASVDNVTVGAAPCTATIIDKFLDKANKSKHELRIMQGFGMTETSPVALLTPFLCPFDKLGSVGQLVPSTQAKVVSISDGQALGPHEPGELLLKGPQVMKGYYKNETATRETIDSEGWLHTGDVAFYDEDQYFFIVDRTKELIKVKGNQVSPTELENVITEMQPVGDVAVIGVADPIAGELPRAFVVLRPGGTLTEKEVYDHVASKLTKYKWLEGGVQFIDAIPRNQTGKTMRNELKALSTRK